MTTIYSVFHILKKYKTCDTKECAASATLNIVNTVLNSALSKASYLHEAGISPPFS